MLLTSYPGATKAMVALLKYCIVCNGTESNQLLSPKLSMMRRTRWCTASAESWVPSGQRVPLRSCVARLSTDSYLMLIFP